jgi:hypothetical protein
MDEAYTGEPGIDWDDEESEERYIDVPKIDSNDSFYVMTSLPSVPNPIPTISYLMP